uniref:Uncharacterized protein n=1 Tax=Oryza glumipatula TaxID=40148 RepID=A0A0E0A827_9ORYZ
MFFPLNPSVAACSSLKLNLFTFPRLFWKKIEVTIDFEEGTSRICRLRRWRHQKRKPAARRRRPMQPAVEPNATANLCPLSLAAGGSAPPREPFRL